MILLELLTQIEFCLLFYFLIKQLYNDGCNTSVELRELFFSYSLIWKKKFEKILKTFKLS